MLRVAELLEAVPGMIAAQHSGSGKANQYFLRGFNLDHGTDFSAFANGVPVNMRTHGHGQGYLDLNFLIPELVETATYRKGTYAAEAGDFSSAGTVSFKYRDELDESLLSATYGSFNFLRALAAGSIAAGEGTATGAIELGGYSGPWDLDEDLEQFKFYGAWSGDLANYQARLSVSGYSSDWSSTDQVPQRAVESGLIGPLGYIDPNLGGNTDRYELNGLLKSENWRALAYFLDYDLGLYSNFTYLLDDPVNGDEFEQTDQRQIFGLRLDGERILSNLPRTAAFRWGVDARYDNIGEVGLYRTAARERLDAVRTDQVDEASVSAYGELGFLLTERLRATVGLRADYFNWDVDALRDVNSGSGNDTAVSPKVNLAYAVNEGLELYANYGRGFHSNDVRGATISIDPTTGDPALPVDAIARSDGAEVGLRFERGERFNATLAAFWLELDSELVFVGDAGTTEPNDGSRRTGIEVAAFWQPLDWLAANFSYSYTDAEYLVDAGAGNHIPGSIAKSAVLGVTGAWNNGTFASIRVRYLGDAPLIEDGSIKSNASTLVNAGIGRRWGRVELRLDAFNLLDTDSSDISYFFASRLAGEPAAGIEDIHSHPLEPRSVRGSVTVHWN
jgi:outer membrane receptor protein involved in Fe transport